MSNAPIRLPPWWNDPVFQDKEVAKIIDVNADTANGWFRLARAMGLDFSRKNGGQRRYSAQDIYVVALVAGFYHLHVPITGPVLAHCFGFATCEDGSPRLPAADDAVMRTADSATFSEGCTAYSAVRTAPVWRMVASRCEELMND